MDASVSLNQHSVTSCYWAIKCICDVCYRVVLIQFRPQFTHILSATSAVQLRDTLLPSIHLLGNLAFVLPPPPEPLASAVPKGSVTS